MIWKDSQRDVAGYCKRNDNREVTLMTATMNMVAYFVGLGDTTLDAKDKVAQLSSEVAAYTYIYVMGNVQPLIDAVNASSLPFMDAAAKTYAVDQLTI